MTDLMSLAATEAEGIKCSVIAQNDQWINHVQYALNTSGSIDQSGR